MRISDWSSDVCSSDLAAARAGRKLNHWGKPGRQPDEGALAAPPPAIWALWQSQPRSPDRLQAAARRSAPSALREGYARSVPQAPVPLPWRAQTRAPGQRRWRPPRSEEHTSELQSLMRISSAVFCLKKKKKLISTAKT